MKKSTLLAFLCFLTLPFTLTAQDKKITVSFSNVSRTAALEAIEKTSDYRFYFDPEWLNSTETVSGNFTDATPETVLQQIFSNTNLNFYIENSRVVLTKNSIIYDKLPENYFGTAITSEPRDETEKPVFQQEFKPENATETQQDASVTLIGKQSKSTEKKLYTLSGYIKKAKTGEPLANVSVLVRNKKISAVTDANGFYTLKVPGGLNSIETESVDHVKTVKKIMVYSDGKLDLGIRESINELEEVVVKAKENDIVRTAVSGVTTIDVETMKNIPVVLGERDLLKVATTLPGIKTTGEGSSGFNVRGGKEDQNLILLDNAVLYNPAHFLGFFSAVNPYTTRKATIYKGSIPAEFGGRLSSVFEITTKNGNMEKISGEGGIGPVTSNLSVGMPVVKGKSSLLLGGRATYSGWILRSLKNDELQGSKAAFYDGILKYSHKFNDNNDLETTVYYSHDDFSITSDSLYKYNNRLVSLKYGHTFNAKNKGALIFTNSEYRFNIGYESRGTESFDFGYKINETQAMVKMNYAFSAKHKFNYGLTTKLYSINPGYLDPKSSESLLVPVTIEKEKALESAVYLSDDFTVSEKLLINIGLRYSVYAALGESTQRIYQPGVPLNDGTVIGEKKYGNNEVIKTYGGLEPRIAARYFLADGFSIKGGFDQTYQYIHLLSSNTTQSPTDTWKLSDNNVEPQVSQQYSLGLYKNLRDNTLELSVEGYFKKSNNILDYKVGAQLLLNENIETELLQGEGKAYGVELLLKKDSGRLNGWIGYTYSRTYIKLDSKFNDEKVNNGQYFAANFDKPHDISAVLNYKFTKRYSLSTNFIYQTGRPITYPVGTYMYNGVEYTLYSDRNKFRIPDYFRLDIGINIEGNHKIKKLAHSFWNISVYNVLGRNNPYSVYFVTENGQIKAYKTSIFSIPVPTITYNFKF